MRPSLSGAISGHSPAQIIYDKYILPFRSHTPQQNYVECTMDREMELG